MKQKVINIVALDGVRTTPNKVKTNVVRKKLALLLFLLPLYSGIFLLYVLFITNLIEIHLKGPVYFLFIYWANSTKAFAANSPYGNTKAYRWLKSYLSATSEWFLPCTWTSVKYCELNVISASTYTLQNTSGEKRIHKRLK